MNLKSLLLLVLVLGAGFAITPPHWYPEGKARDWLMENQVTLGLDLAGGTELDYKIDLSEVEAQNTDDDPTNDLSAYDINNLAESVRDSLEARVNPAGVAETVVKRSQVEGEEHVLIQLPPSTNVAEVKRNAEQDNTLEFFEEDTAVETATLGVIEAERLQTTASNWNDQVKELTQVRNNRGLIELVTGENIAKSAMRDTALAEKLESTPAGQVLGEVITTVLYESVPLSQSSMAAQLQGMGAEQMASIMVEQPRGEFTGIVYLQDKGSTETEETVPQSVTAQHILFGYTGADRADDTVPYATAAEARAAAEDVLQQLQAAGEAADFAALAAQYSTDTTTKDTGGDLGIVTPGQMVEAFDTAIFAATEPGLIPTVVETPFGYHVIRVGQLTPESTKTVSEPTFTYEMIAWDRGALPWVDAGLGGKQLEKAIPQLNQINQPEVVLLFDAAGGEIFSDLTQRMAGRTCREVPEGVNAATYDKRLTACRLGIKIGGQFISTPTVTEHIPGRQVSISGGFASMDEARQLARDLNLGAIDAPVSLSGQTTIQPELGAVQLRQSLQAAAIGIIAIFVYLLLQYRLAGLIAGVTMLIYGVLFIALLELSGTTIGQEFGGPVVLSLAGVAGIALSIGMAVDGNILIFERMREELQSGKHLLSALDAGFKRAARAIWDSQLTTVLVCVILFYFGKSVVRGFAVTLLLGTILSLFTVLVISQALLKWAVRRQWLRNPALYASGLSSSK